MELDLRNLQPGLVVKNYQRMCALLDVPPTDGNSKKAQIKEWRRYFDFERKGHKFIIYEIYEMPKPVWSDKLYIKYFELLLMLELASKPGFIATYTKGQLFELLGMVNHEYGQYRKITYNQDLTPERRDELLPKHVKNRLSTVPQGQVKSFFQRSSNRLTDTLFDALNSMKRRRILDYDEQIVIVSAERKHERWVANDKERQKVMDTEKQALGSMGLNEAPFCLHKQREYRKRVDALLLDKYKWARCYRQYKLIFSSDAIAGDIPVVLYEMLEIINVHNALLDVRTLYELDTTLKAQIAKVGMLKVNAEVIDTLDRQLVSDMNRVDEKYIEAYHRYYNDDEWGNPPPIDMENRQQFPGVYNYPKSTIYNNEKLMDLFVVLDS